MWVQYYDFEKNDFSPFVILVMALSVSLLAIVPQFYSKFTAIYGNKRNENTKKKNNSISTIVISSIAFVLYLLIFVLAIIGLISDYSNLDELKKNIQIVEGYVENFKAGAGRKEESFKVANINFKYRAGSMTWSYRKVYSDGGGIDSGKYVRIHYHEGKILRLWVLEKTKK
jgi:hypothetical protein